MEIRNWPERKSASKWSDDCEYNRGFNDSLDLCASAVRGNMMTVDALKVDLGTTSIMVEGRYQTLENWIGFENVDKLAEVIHAAQLKKMFGEK